MNALNPTPEQDTAVGLFMTGDPLVIEAGAGTGKTQTLEFIARSTERIGTYVAFNRAIVNEAAVRFPMSVRCSTAHSLAMRAVGGMFRDRLNGQRVASWQLAKFLDIGPVVCRTGDRDKKLSAGYLAGLVMKGVNAWCASDRPAPTGAFIPWVHGIDGVDSDGARDTRNNRELRQHLEPKLAEAWEDLCSPGGRLNVTHSHYLKYWTMHEPTVASEYLLVDEAQDLNPCMMSVIAHNAQRGAQVVLVGDPNQQIYEWNGAIDAMAKVDYQRTFLSQSWRFGQDVADVANMLLDELGADLRLTGNPAIASRVGACTPSAVLCRSNTGALDAVLRFQRAGRRPHLVGGGEELVRFAKGVADLQEKGSSTHPDLACFDSWPELLAYVEQDPAGDELALMVRMIQEYGLQIVIDALDGMIAESEADVIVSTAHKAKGREWDAVRLAGDFPDPATRGPGGMDAELRLGYVACTRARDVLDIRMVEYLADLVGLQGRGAADRGSTATAAP